MIFNHIITSMTFPSATISLLSIKLRYPIPQSLAVGCTNIVLAHASSSISAVVYIFKKEGVFSNTFPVFLSIMLIKRVTTIT